MGLFFRKSIDLGLFKINFSKSGVSFSFGLKGARVNINSKRTQLHLGRGGVYYKKNIANKDLLHR